MRAGGGVADNNTTTTIAHAKKRGRVLNTRAEEGKKIKKLPIARPVSHVRAHACMYMYVPAPVCLSIRIPTQPILTYMESVIPSEDHPPPFPSDIYPLPTHLHLHFPFALPHPPPPPPKTPPWDMLCPDSYVRMHIHTRSVQHFTSKHVAVCWIGADHPQLLPPLQLAPNQLLASTQLNSYLHPAS